MLQKLIFHELGDFFCLVHLWETDRVREILILLDRKQKHWLNHVRDCVDKFHRLILLRQRSKLDVTFKWNNCVLLLIRLTFIFQIFSDTILVCWDNRKLMLHSAYLSSGTLGKARATQWLIQLFLFRYWQQVVNLHFVWKLLFILITSFGFGMKLILSGKTIAYTVLFQLNPSEHSLN